MGEAALKAGYGGWMVWFCRQPLDTPKYKLKKGQLFPAQDKTGIRGWGATFGVRNAEDLPFDQLRYVMGVELDSGVLADQCIRQNLTYEQTKALVGGDA